VAISLRRSALRTFARAWPPFRPPPLPRSIARGSRLSSTRSSISPVAISTMSFASWAGSRGRLRRFSATRHRDVAGRAGKFDRRRASAHFLNTKPLGHAIDLKMGRAHIPMVLLGHGHRSRVPAPWAGYLKATCVARRHALNMACPEPIGNPASRVPDFRLTHYTASASAIARASMSASISSKTLLVSAINILRQ